MGVEIDWSKAPEGAIAALVRQPLFVGRVETFHEAGIEYFCGEDVSGLPYRLRVGRVTKVNRPSTWSGEGLPPVGTVCEYQVSGGTWYQCTVRYITKPIPGDDVQVVIECAHLFGEQLAVAGNEPGHVAFRPLRTPEQIAAEEREKAINELAAELAGHWSAEAVSTQRDMAAYLHDVGYRKVTP